MTASCGELAWPRAILTLGAMREAQVLVEAACESCGRRTTVDVARLECTHGPYTSLVDRRPVCGGCGSSGRYLARLRGETHDLLTPDFWDPLRVCGWCGGSMGQHHRREWWLPERRPPLCQEA